MSRVERIGLATLYLGDSREIVPTLGQIDVVLTDPPYGMRFRSNFRKERYAVIAGDDGDDLLLWACGLAPVHSAYIFCRWDNLGFVPRPKSLVTWVKNNWSMGDLKHEHARQTETILFYPGPRHDFPAGRPTDVIHEARTQNKFHPTEKPVALIKRVAGWTSGVIMDPFMGSGSAGVAAASLGRPFIGIEAEVKYFDVACRRIEDAKKPLAA